MAESTTLVTTSKSSPGHSKPDMLEGCEKLARPHRTFHCGRDAVRVKRDRLVFRHEALG